MDPFLEAPTEWGEFHSRFIHALSDALVALIAPHFVVSVEKRVYVLAANEEGATVERQIVPDVFVYQQPSDRPRRVGEMSSAYMPTYIEPLDEPEVREYYLEIREPHQREVISTIEMCSPFNKSAGTNGSDEFMRKRRVVMASRTHWVEIDLLRGGERPVEVHGRSDYYTLLKRAGDSRYEVCYFNLRDILPVIAVPLRAPFKDALVDLQPVFNSSYVRGQFAIKLNYNAILPLPRLNPADERWVRDCITVWQEAGNMN